MGKQRRHQPLPADKRVLRDELLLRYPHWWAAGLDVDFVVDQCYKDFYYLQKIEKLNLEDSNRPVFGGENVAMKPIYKLSPGDPEYDAEMEKAKKNNLKVLESSVEKYAPKLKELDERTNGHSITFE